MPHNQGVTDAAQPGPTELPEPEPTELPEPELRATKPWSRGYRQAEVDAFVADLRRAYSQRPPGMAPYEVADQQFSPTRFGKGYTMQSVDAYLETAQDLLRRRHGADAVADVHGREAPVRHRHFPTELIYVAAGLVIVALVVFLALTQF